MSYQIIYLGRYTNDYFQTCKIEELQNNIDKISLENNVKQHDNLKTIALFSEISEQFCSRKENINFFESVTNLAKNNNLSHYFLLDSWFKKEHAVQFSNVIYCSYMILITYWMFIVGHNKRAQRWYPEHNFGLFLTGKINKINRGYLLYHLWKQKVTDNLIWSFYDADINYQHLKQEFLSFVSDEEYNNFLNDCVKILDLNFRKDFIAKKEVFSFNCYPMDITLYEKTSFSIVSETLFYNSDYPAISEKTFRAIINYHPFIVAGNSGLLTKLESIGFKVFREYLDHPNYNDFEYNNDERINLIVENSKTFGNNLLKHKSKVEQDVIHNANLLEKICTDEVKYITSALNADESIVDQIILAHKCE